MKKTEQKFNVDLQTAQSSTNVSLRLSHTLTSPDNFHAIIVLESFRFHFFAFTCANEAKHRLKWHKINVNINGDSTG